MRKFSKINEGLNVGKVKSETLVYFDLFPLLRGLESERPGIKNRIWKWLCDEWDSSFKVYNGRIKNINLFFYGVGDEYPLKYNKEYPEEVERSKTIHPNAFVGHMGDGSGSEEEQNRRIDLNMVCL